MSTLTKGIGAVVLCLCVLLVVSEAGFRSFAAPLPKPVKEVEACDPRVMRFAAGLEERPPAALKLVSPSARILAAVRRGPVSLSFVYSAANGIAAETLSAGSPIHPAAWEQLALTDWLLRNWTGEEIAKDWCSTAVFTRDVVGFRRAAEVVMKTKPECLSDIEIAALFVAALSSKGAFWSLCENHHAIVPSQRGVDKRSHDGVEDNSHWREWCETERERRASAVQL